MVTSENKEREPPMPLHHLHPNTKGHSPQTMAWYRPDPAPVLSKFPGGDQSGTNNSAFHPVSPYDRAKPRPVVLKFYPAVEENTQVTWCCCTGANYRCSIAVTGTERLWGLEPRNRWTNSSDTASHCSKEYEEEDEEEDEIDVGDCETNTSPRSKDNEGSICMSLASAKAPSAVGRLRTVVSTPITITSGSARDFPMTEGAAQNRHSVVQGSIEIGRRPIYMPEIAGLQPLAPTKTDSKSGTGLPEDGSQLSMETDNGEECRLPSSASPPKIGEHFPSEYVTAARLAEDDIFIKAEGRPLRARTYSITEHELTTPTTSPTRSSEDNNVDCSFGERKFCRKEDDETLNTFTHVAEESPVFNVRGAVRECPTAETAGDEVNYSQTILSDAYDPGMTPTVMKRNFPRHTSPPANAREADVSVLVGTNLSKPLSERHGDKESSAMKRPENADKQSLREQQSSLVLRSTQINRTQICGKQSFEEKLISNQDERKTQVDSDQSSEDRGESPHKRSHLDDDDDYKWRSVDRCDLPHEGSPVKTRNPITDENVIENGREYIPRNSLVVTPTQGADEHHLEDKGGFLRSTPSEPRVQSAVVGTERNSSLENETAINNQQREEGRGLSARNNQRESQRILHDQSTPRQRSSVLVRSRELRPGGGETVIQQVGTASGPELSTGVQGPPPFSAEDSALRSRVLILLWILLGERRLCEVGYPVEPVHRVLWRVVDVCCSVAGVKSAAAVPLNADHDCGSDMLCFRDHTHRFLEVCAPTREHWKQFGWASLTVDAVVRKIYDEELLPLLRLQVLPPAIERAISQLSHTDHTPNPQHVSGGSTAGGKLLTAVVMPTKKKRGRPAKITNKVDEGGRIERVMLWRFLLNLLEDPRNSPCIHWVQRDEGIFRILNTDWLARLWGRRHGNPRMTYEKMARAMRTYYRSKVLQPVPRLRNLPRKLVYKFNPAVIHKVAAMKLSCSTFSGRGLNYNNNISK
ncbi:uncharacterized protein LOC110834832 [Zootermopsis nevadensis]|uniref:ETS-related transcription factor Elf-1 n=1 Tax=Zootermopsis nevadensis TaxID=136037 RepID=A0A067QVA4_ZOONE|nr:uncharacterized protein LOC110834832 [Zootermopsis nevadensis]XP_021930067.1 uncharacterized protein LOC110834832 [Zootermopsis nevadensis]KDR14118.1 ETS-related transcription factor Elf-1 [Zootermopsis nevadensis]